MSNEDIYKKEYLSGTGVGVGKGNDVDMPGRLHMDDQLDRIAKLQAAISTAREGTHNDNL